MASWIVHLRVADGLTRIFPQLLNPEFIMGNIAPDSGVPNPGGSGFLPPKEISHLSKQEGDHRFADWQRYAEIYLSYERRAGYSDCDLSFHLGYFSHLFTDACWSKRIVLPLIAREPEAYAEDSHKTVGKWKKDWYDLDFLYLRENPGFSAYRIFSGIASMPNIWLDFFDADAFDRVRKRITEFYSEKRDNLDRDYPWLNRAQADEFVLSVTASLADKIKALI